VSSVWTDDPIPDVAYARVVVGVSASLATFAPLHRAAEQAPRLGTGLVAVHCWTPPGGEADYLDQPRSPLLGIWEQQAQERLAATLRDAFADCPPCPIAPVVVRGAPGPALVDVASDPAELLVIGSGRPSWARLLRQASVARYCQRRARCPVLCVPESELLRDRSAAGDLRRRRP
jgi:nucleotide-binding universal stress UspA family protein